MSNSIYGIDLGTTYSSAAVLQAGTVLPLDVDTRSRALASVVWLDHSDGSTVVCVGQSAIDARENAPNGEGKFIQGSKRFMGMPVSPRHPEPPWVFGGWSYDSRDAAALILRKIKQRIDEVRPQDPLVRAVITHPAYFATGAKNATKQAAELAGIDVVATITEPGAAAVRYGVVNAEPGHYVVFDLGGGTLDVTVLEVLPGRVIQLKHHHGDSRLGGLDWDNAILNHVYERFQADHPDIDVWGTVPGNDQLRERWLSMAREMKEKLGVTPWYEKKFVLETPQADYSSRIRLERPAFEELTRPLANRCHEILVEAVKGSGVPWEEIRGVLPVGGSTRLRFVAPMIEAVSGKKPLSGIDPDLAVAEGAAYVGAEYVRRSADERVREILADGEAVDEDVPSLTIGATVQDCLARDLRILIKEPGTGRSICFPIATKGQPTGRKYDKQFQTSADNQTQVHVKIFEGEDEDPSCCTLIGDVRIEGIPPKPKGQPVVVAFNVPDGGCLEVNVQEMSSGKTVRATLDVAHASLDDFDTRKAHLQGVRIE